ncbi:hypothetical protein COW91_01870 [Candidatus Nomurabacteria bacterium CG22_combo_CG10-13_8_21_14_all_32_8]|uniref:Uncharacterized protein n=1 Tax=Candidatus Nomurabacteria bacterium CG22_combo_CG10-13_8_21_14_all_32_8 TaxID=1974732 RepID=A0A2H0CGG3_9BACT|nr:MAG: hypothetical protein COW91_01870 [Candidatus Nomurabacteria bacterium CG22_combo_CG10-13_8_21_14_all_32_8]
MNTKSKILIVLLGILIVLSISATYYRFFVLKDYDTYFENYDEEVNNSIDTDISFKQQMNFETKYAK